jgi:hypothetical protein
MSNMPRRDLVVWAKEMVLDAIDEMIKDEADKPTSHQEGSSFFSGSGDEEEVAELKRQRDRVASFLRISADERTPK